MIPSLHSYMHIARTSSRNLERQKLTIVRLAFTANLLHRPTEGAILFGSLAGSHIRGQWTEPSAYANLTPLEAELRRRIYWIAYGGDRSWAAIEGSHTVYPEEEINSDLPYPLEIDDEFISDAGISEQPEGTTSLISGFVGITRIYRICGQVMDRRRRDKKAPPQGVLLQMRLNEVNDLYDQVVGVMDGCPEVLRLELESDARSNEYVLCPYFQIGRLAGRFGRSDADVEVVSLKTGTRTHPPVSGVFSSIPKLAKR